ncbi:MAG TPA: GNAT family N-acetyltransferase [Saprospiraceae bacterium]|nr:GNAT family N-acetyltransferase [Saprospiraceae bacterium]HMQ84810.1 GNAT family N-acetyltransferase [Saprospiraceae bacterium]
MTIREANIGDIEQVQLIRNLVKENKLSNPSLVTDEHCRLFITERGKGWVCEKDNQIIGFSIVDMEDHNIWALFVHPDFHKQGVGRRLHDIMLDWYFSQTDQTVWLGTEPNTRAAAFYKKAGWSAVGTYSNGEIKFQMTYESWIKKPRD